MHPFKAWLKLQKHDGRWAAGRLRVSATTISRWFMGAREMQLKHRLAVEALTGRGVTRSAIEDWHAQHLKRLRGGTGGAIAEAANA